MTYAAFYRNPQGMVTTGLTEAQIRDALATPGGLLWVDFPQTSPEDGELMEKVFGFHPLAVADCVSPEVHPPKIDDFEDYLFLIVHGINYEATGALVETAELGLFLGKNYVVTCPNASILALAHIRNDVQSSGRLLQRGADLLAYAIMDALIANIMPVVDRMTEVLDDIETEVLQFPNQPVLEAILRLKRSVQRLHRIMIPQRDIFNRLSRGDHALVTKDAQVFYRDVYDRIARLQDLTQGLRDLADNALETYLSSVSVRQNETMKTLTIVATIVLPLSLLASIYGMNFEHMPELAWRWAYFAVLGFMALFATVMLVFFFAREWVRRSRQRLRNTALFFIHPQHLMGIGRLPRHILLRTFWAER
ncbi:MAG: magnesium/cobalt transporter CorA [Chloroflexi bacterium]|nr:magnesium/cobalt transporter CorA [Chloroflexota bacterium]